MVLRPGFTEWIDSQADPAWEMLPLTHITNGLRAEDIIRAEKLEANYCEVLKSTRAFLFVGRPSFRYGKDESIKSEAACPVCFIFDSTLITTSTDIFAFDTGAYGSRMYKHVIDDEMDVWDFSLDRNPARVNRLIAKTFASQQNYLRPVPGNIIDAEIGASPWEFHARSYLRLIRSSGRNEPDDRISTVEVSFDSDIDIVPALKAVIVPHTLWGPKGEAPWLSAIKQKTSSEIETYIFLPGRSVDYYYALIESLVFDLYGKWGIV